MVELLDTRSPPDLRRSYALVMIIEVIAIAALWALQQLFA
jgi:hypothetical protein